MSTPTSLTAEQVKKIADLACLTLSEDDIHYYAPQLSRILDFFAEMNSCETSQVAPLAHPLDLPQRLRADEITEFDQRALFQSIAPEVKAGLYLVPKVIEEVK